MRRTLLFFGWEGPKRYSARGTVQGSGLNCGRMENGCRRSSSTFMIENKVMPQITFEQAYQVKLCKCEDRRVRLRRLDVLEAV